MIVLLSPVPGLGNHNRLNVARDVLTASFWQLLQASIQRSCLLYDQYIREGFGVLQMHLSLAKFI